MCRIDSQIFQWLLHFFIQIIVLAACLQESGGFASIWPLAHAKFACDWQPAAYKLYPSGCQSHINCTRVAACHNNKIDKNLHATGGRLQGKRQADKRCAKGCLYIIIIFLALASPHPRRMLPTIQLTILGYLV
jgi:hypothetical protein